MGLSPSVSMAASSYEEANVYQGTMIKTHFQGLIEFKYA